nr:MAG TPA: hypothetical protein [Caudoviricetes sp.]
MFGVDNDTSTPSIRLKTVSLIYYPHRARAAGPTHAISHFRFYFSSISKTNLKFKKPVPDKDFFNFLKYFSYFLINFL